MSRNPSIWRLSCLLLSATFVMQTAASPALAQSKRAKVVPAKKTINHSKAFAASEQAYEQLNLLDQLPEGTLKGKAIENVEPESVAAEEPAADAVAEPDVNATVEAAPPNGMQPAMGMNYNNGNNMNNMQSGMNMNYNNGNNMNNMQSGMGMNYNNGNNMNNMQSGMGMNYNNGNNMNGMQSGMGMNYNNGNNMNGMQSGMGMNYNNGNNMNGMQSGMGMNYNNGNNSNGMDFGLGGLSSLLGGSGPNPLSQAIGAAAVLGGLSVGPSLLGGMLKSAPFNNNVGGRTNRGGFRRLGP